VQAICPGSCRRADADFLLAAEIVIPTGASELLAAVHGSPKSAAMVTMVSSRVI
jgi:hypothetical protein